jgi:hypothetical protein
VRGGVFVEVAGAVDLRGVVGQVAAEVEEAGALLGDDAVGE